MPSGKVVILSEAKDLLFAAQRVSGWYISTLRGV
jgi:hypothetical protein